MAPILAHSGAMIALFTALALLALADAAPPAALTVGQTADAQRLSQCLKDAEADPEKTYEVAMAWAGEAFVQEAFVCAAVANVERGRPVYGAKRLDLLGLTARTEADRVELYVRAGHAWLLAQDPARAKASFDKAIAIAAKEARLYQDRAGAFALMRNWKAAELDLNAALDLDPKAAEALAMRAQARLELGALDLAQKDAEEALKLAPNLTVAAVTLGDIREAKRGAPPR
jgi:tetratricopeptide (TPR) repeat protein